MHPIKKYAISLGSFVLFLIIIPASAHAVNVFKTGWWTQIGEESKLAGYASDGNTLVLLNGGGWYTSPDPTWESNKIKLYLDEAQKYNIKVIISLTRSVHTPYGISVTDFVDTINTLKNHPALYGWYIGDEPELYKNNDSNSSDDWQIPYNYLATDPGYYSLIKENDPNHPILISFNTLYTPYDTYWAKLSNFFPVTDIVGLHSYPFWTPNQPNFPEVTLGRNTMSGNTPWNTP